MRRYQYAVPAGMWFTDDVTPSDVEKDRRTLEDATGQRVKGPSGHVWTFEPRPSLTNPYAVDPLFVPEDPIPDRPRWPLATWTVGLSILAVLIVLALLIEKAR